LFKQRVIETNFMTAAINRQGVSEGKGFFGVGRALSSQGIGMDKMIYYNKKSGNC
jgi:hypothetical protein